MQYWITGRPWHGTQLPYSDRWGPTDVHGDIATRYGPPPEGAVIAMMQHQARLAGATDWLPAATAMAVVAPGASRSTSAAPVRPNKYSSTSPGGPVRRTDGSPRRARTTSGVPDRASSRPLPRNRRVRNHSARPTTYQSAASLAAEFTRGPGQPRRTAIS